MGESAARWWDLAVCDVYGVFKGGGAKGVLYAGAVRALHAKGHWFRAVAGASAGAITAALVAAGVHPDEFPRKASDGLATIQRNWLFDLAGRPFVRTTRLSKWLEDLLVSRVIALKGARSGSDPVTFQELWDTTGIDLYVVTVNVATQQPVVFNYITTPALSVTSAVMASSAIPFAFRPGRLRVTTPAGEEVHRMMDGGVWANYPMFVFRDASFRAYHQLPPIPTTGRIIGFTLDSHATDAPATAVAFEKQTTQAAGDRGAGMPFFLRS